MNTNNLKFISWFVVGMALVAATTAMLLRSTQEETLAQGFSTAFAMSIAVAILELGAAVIFLMGLKYFRARLKVAYGVLCVGIVMIGVTQLSTPLLMVLGLNDTPLRGLTIIPIALSVAGIYVGMKLFVKLFNVKSIWRRGWFVTLVAIVAGVIGTMIPHGGEVTSEEVYRSTIAFIFFGTTFDLAAAILAYKVRFQASQIYNQALKWLFYGFAMQTFVGAHAALAFMAFGDAGAYVSYGGTIFPQVLGGLLYVKAAYEFNRIEFEGTPVTIKSAQATAVDIVYHTAMQVSNPSDIDELLDEMRAITSIQDADQPISPTVNAKLKDIYLRLEDYLVTKEPVRSFTVERLRNLIAKQLHITGKTGSFWDELPKEKPSA